MKRKERNKAARMPVQVGDNQSRPIPSNEGSAGIKPAKKVSGEPKPAVWTRAEIAANIISCLALLVAGWSVWLQRETLAAAHKLILKAEITDAGFTTTRRGAMILSPVDSSHQIQSVTVTSPKLGYGENLTHAASSKQLMIDYDTVLGRAARIVEKSAPKQPPTDNFWACKDTLPVAMEAEYIAGGKRRLHRGLYAIHFVHLMYKDRVTDGRLEMSSISYVRDLTDAEKANEVADTEFSKRSFKWD